MLSEAFLDEVRARTTLSTIVGRDVKLVKAGREWKGCCPFHQEKTASFTINDDKGFYHCFGCSAHGDVIRWLVERKGLPFLDAVAELASAAGLAMPARSAEQVAREQRAGDLHALLAAAAEWYAEQLTEQPAAVAYLTERGLDEAACAEFGLGWAPSRRSVLQALRGAREDDLLAAGLARRDEGSGLLRDFLWNRVTIPVRDARGRVCGFAGRSLPVTPLPGGGHIGQQGPKYVNSPDGPVFDKGGLLFNLDRAGPRSREQRRLIVVEGQLDAIALDRLGLPAVAPMGTALTERQLSRAWRAVNVPTLLFDGDDAGAAASTRAGTRALRAVGPGASLTIARCPPGVDPDALAQSGGIDAVEAVLAEARPVADALFDDAAAQVDPRGPESRAAGWAQLKGWAETIVDLETRAQYLMIWRERFDRRFAVDIGGAGAVELVAIGRDGEDDPSRTLPPDVAAARLMAIVAALRRLKVERSEVNDRIKDLMDLAKLTGFEPKSIRAVAAMLDQDEDARQADEAVLALYRRTCGVQGPMTEAMLPPAVDVRAPRAVSPGAKRLSRVAALLAADQAIEGYA